MNWQAHVTVATVIEDQGRFLFVEELQQGQPVLNQPAGHLDPNESLQQAAVRETLEETGWDVELTGVVGIYLYTAPSNGVTYQRICFAARALRHHPDYRLDEGIIGPVWLSREQLLEQQPRWRSELVLRCVDDYLTGERFSLALLRDKA
ncbi:NUDIX hydrolase [Pseudomonas sp. Leaf127]|uniref:NUDIX hydrolase n=1 Tax=Pseudomonas sp. Leaf127 TaxID=1736267 RepID=UPI00070388B2|nr:NUDIX hydrolase [Pseudomonas sp. Leaf127]KQQ59867.1 NUDIX hydrolase [Pseudomonas sp. Leaf127]